MKSTINKIYIISTIVLAFFILNACSHSHKDEHNHEHNHNSEITENSAHNHGEENSVTLTGEQIKAVGIKIGTIERKQLSETMNVNGILRVPNSNKANVMSLLGGIVESLNVELGDYVKKDQVIASISNLQFLQLQEEYLNIINRIKFAELEFSRQKELNEGNVGAKKNLQNSVTELNDLKVRKASLNKQIQLLGINPDSLSDTNLKSLLEIKSPINGTISEVFAKIGSYIDLTSPIVEIVENSALHLDLHVFEKDIPKIKIGQKIDFVVTNNPDKMYSAEVYSIGSSFSGSSKAIVVHSKIIGDKKNLINGMNISGIISLHDTPSFVVPNESIVDYNGKYYMFLVENPEYHDNLEETISFERIEVFKGASQLGYTAITPIREIPNDAKIVIKSAFFINAKMNDTGEHDHIH